MPRLTEGVLPGRRSSPDRVPKDDEIFSALVRRHTKAVRTYAYSIAGTPTIAEDAVQETFVRAWRYRGSFRGTGSRESWLLRICRNAVYDLSARESKGVPGHRIEVVRLDQGHSHQTLAAFDGDPGQFGSDVVELVNQLPVIQREVLVLCGVLGHSYESASEVLDVPVGTVRSRLSRARRALEKLLAPDAEVA